MRRGWTSWLACVEARASARRAAELAVRSLLNRSVRPAFSAWAEHWLDGQRSSRLAQRSASHFTEGGRALGGSHRRWASYAAQQSCLRRGWSALRRRGQRRALTSWRVYASSRERSLSLVARSIGALHHSSMHRGWLPWLSFVAAREKALQTAALTVTCLQNKLLNVCQRS